MWHGLVTLWKAEIFAQVTEHNSYVNDFNTIGSAEEYSVLKVFKHWSVAGASVPNNGFIDC